MESHPLSSWSISAVKFSYFSVYGIEQVVYDKILLGIKNRATFMLYSYFEFIHKIVPAFLVSVIFIITALCLEILSWHTGATDDLFLEFWWHLLWAFKTTFLLACRFYWNFTGAELSLNLVNSANAMNLINHWSMSGVQFKDPLCYLWPSGGISVSNKGSNTAILLILIFLSLNSLKLVKTL